MWLKTKITKIRNLIDKLKSTLQKTYGENIKRIHLISITEKERKEEQRKEEVREGKRRKNPNQGSESESHTLLKWKWKSHITVWLFVTPWAIKSMEFSRPEYWSGQPFPSPGDLPNPGIKDNLIMLASKITYICFLLTTFYVGDRALCTSGPTYVEGGLISVWFSFVTGISAVESCKASWERCTFTSESIKVWVVV